jgi:hypothetical protein
MRALSTLARIDYEDTFRVELAKPESKSAEEWARAIFDRTPRALRAQMWSAWRALGFRLGSPFTRDLVLGWELRRTSPEVAVLGTHSWIGMPAELVVRRDQRGLLFATFVGMHNPFARAVWAAIDPVHRPAARRVLSALASDSLGAAAGEGAEPISVLAKDSDG